MAKLIITVEGGKVTQTLNFLDRNIKDNRYVYGNGNESGIMEDPEKIYGDCLLYTSESRHPVLFPVMFCRNRNQIQVVFHRFIFHLSFHTPFRHFPVLPANRPSPETRGPPTTSDSYCG